MCRSSDTGHAPAVACAALAAAFFAAAWRFMTFPGFNNDHYAHVARAYQILLGEWPVRDFVDPGMPLMYVVSAAARAVAGPALLTEFRVVAGGFAVGAACTVIAAAKLSRSVAVALVVAAVEVIVNPRSFGYPKILLYALAAVVIVHAARRPTSRAIAALGIVSAMAFLFRHDHGLFIGTAAVATVLMASRGEGSRVTARRVAVLGAWIGGLLAPWALFVQFHLGLAEYVASAIMFSRAEAVGTTLRTIPALQWPLDTKANALSWLFYVFHVLPFLSLALVARRHAAGREAWPGESVAVAALAVMAIPVNVVFMRDSLEGRVPDAIVPAALLGAWLLGLAFRRDADRFRPARIVCAAIALVLTMGAVFYAADVREQLGRTGVLSRPEAVRARAGDLWERLNRTMPERDHVPSRYSRAMLPYIEYVRRCTSRDDRLMMTGLFPEVYVIADRGFAGGHMALQPGFYTAETEEARTIARLERQSVPFVLLVESLEPDLRSEMPRLFAYLDQRYRPMTHIAVPETKGVRVNVEQRRDARGVDPLTGWPCFR